MDIVKKKTFHACHLPIYDFEVVCLSKNMEEKKVIISCSNDKGLHCFEENGISKKIGHSCNIYSILFLPESQKFLTTDFRGNLVIWNVFQNIMKIGTIRVCESGSILWKLIRLSEKCFACCVSNGNSRGSVYKINMQGMKNSGEVKELVYRKNGRKERMMCLHQLKSRSKFILFAGGDLSKEDGKDYVIHSLNWEEERCYLKFDKHEYCVLAISSFLVKDEDEEELIISAGSDKKLIIWNLKGEVLKLMKIKSQIHSIYVSNNSEVFVGNNLGCISYSRLENIAELFEVESFLSKKVHDEAVSKIFVENEKEYKIFSCCWDGSICISECVFHPVNQIVQTEYQYVDDEVQTDVSLYNRNENLQIGNTIPEMIQKLENVEGDHEAAVLFQQISSILITDKKCCLELQFIPLVKNFEIVLLEKFIIVEAIYKNLYQAISLLLCYKEKVDSLLLWNGDVFCFEELFKKINELSFVVLEKKIDVFSSILEYFKKIRKQYSNFYMLNEENEDCFQIRLLKRKIHELIQKMRIFQISINRIRKRRSVILEVDKPIITNICLLMEVEENINSNWKEVWVEIEGRTFDEVKQHLKVCREVFNKEKDFLTSKTRLNNLIEKNSVFVKKELQNNINNIEQYFKKFKKKFELFKSEVHIASQSLKSSVNILEALDLDLRTVPGNFSIIDNNYTNFLILMSKIQGGKCKFSEMFKNRIVNLCEAMQSVHLKISKILDNSCRIQKIQRKIEEKSLDVEKLYIEEEMKKKETVIVLNNFIESFAVGRNILRTKKTLKDIESKLRKVESDLISLRNTVEKDDADLEIIGFFFENDEEELEGENDQNSLKEKQKEFEVLKNQKSVETSKLYMEKRRLEKFQRTIYVKGWQTLNFLKSKLESQKGDKFVFFLKKQKPCIFFERTLSDYSDLKPISSNFGDVFFGILEGDFAEEPKIIKVLDYDDKYAPQSEDRIQNEIRCLLILKDHPSIIPVNAVFIYRDERFKMKKIGIEMDYYKTDLFRWLKGYSFVDNFDGNLKEKKTVRKKKSIYRVFRKILEGISFIHSKGIQHRDLKPQNILLNSEDEVKIIDFGIARDSMLTLTRNAGATLRYLSKYDRDGISNEQKLKGLRAEDYEKRDMFAFGMMLLESLCPPEYYDKLYELIGPISVYDFFKEHNEEVYWKGKFKLTIEEMNVIRKLLDPDPKRRISSKEALGCDLFQLHLQKGFVVEEFDIKKLIREKNIEIVRAKFHHLYQQNKPQNRNLRRDVKLDLGIMTDISKRKKKKTNILRDCFNQSIEKCSNLKELLIPFNVKFKGDKATDAGGVTRKLFSLIFEEIILTKCQHIGKYYLPSDFEDFSDIFFNVGKFFLKCLLEKRTFRIPFGPLFYSFILYQEPQKDKDWIKYCKLYDKKYVKSVERALFDSKEFKNMIEKKSTFHNRENLECFLTEENKREYFICNILEKLKGELNCNRIDKNIFSFKKGFYSLIPENFQIELMSLLNPFEFEKMVFGDQKITKEIIFKNLEFDKKFEFVPKYFDTFFSNCSVKKLWDFILYCCGSCDLINEKLYKDGEIKKIFVRLEEFRDPNKNRAIMSFTCGFILRIGKNFDEANKYYEFKERLDWILNNFRFHGMAD